MAIVKSKPIKDKPKKTIEYIINPEKTQNGKLVTGINVIATADAADSKMLWIRERYGVNEKIKARHIIHSFSSKEDISPDLAHVISLEWYRRVFPEDSLAVAATHIKREEVNGENCVHTHFLVNNVTASGERVLTDLDLIEKAKGISNDLCKEYGLKYSIVESKMLGTSKNWYEYQQEKIGNGWKQKIREDVDRLIITSKNIEELYFFLQEEGYEIKTDRKYVAIRPEGKERFVRIKSLGYNYSEEQIKNRILGLDKYNLESIGYKNYRNNKWIDKDIYRYKFKKASIGNIIQLTAKIIATQLDMYSNDKKYTMHNYKAEKELAAIEKTLNIIQTNEFENREDVVKAYNNLDIELKKIKQWRSKAQKKIDDINSIAEQINKINKQIELVNIKENECLNKQNEFKNTLKTFDKCRNKDYEKIYEDIDKEPSR